MESKDVFCMPNIACFLASGTDEGFNMAVSALKVILIDYSKKKKFNALLET